LHEAEIGDIGIGLERRTATLLPALASSPALALDFFTLPVFSSTINRHNKLIVMTFWILAQNMLYIPEAYSI
jgi:hypothetical protein